MHLRVALVIAITMTVIGYDGPLNLVGSMVLMKIIIFLHASTLEEPTVFMANMHILTSGGRYWYSCENKPWSTVKSGCKMEKCSLLANFD